MKVTIPDLDLEKNMNSGQIFRMYKQENNSYVIYSADKRLEIQSLSANTFDLSCDAEEYDIYWKAYFDIDTDYSDILMKIDKDDTYLSHAAAYGKGIRVFRQDTWEMIISFIISQQKRISDIRRCIEALCERFGKKQIRNNSMWHAFPEASAIAEAGPDGVKGLSLGYREKYIYETAVKYLHDEHLQDDLKHMNYEEAKAHLKAYPGIGEKVANCICLFGLNHKDAFPIDVHIKDILYREYYSGDMPKEKLIDKDYNLITEKFFFKYTGFRGIVQQWMFAYEIN